MDLWGGVGGGCGVKGLVEIGKVCGQIRPSLPTTTTTTPAIVRAYLRALAVVLVLHGEVQPLHALEHLLEGVLRLGQHGLDGHACAGRGWMGGMASPLVSFVRLTPDPEPPPISRTGLEAAALEDLRQRGGEERGHQLVVVGALAVRLLSLEVWMLGVDEISEQQQGGVVHPSIPTHKHRNRHTPA